MRACLGLGLLALTLVSGCQLYFGNGGDDDPCAYPADGDGGAAPGYYYEIRDPATGQCVPGGGGGYPCDDRCGPCPVAGAEPEPAPIPPEQDWGQCYGSCTGLDAESCQATPGCFAAYLQHPYNDGPSQFWGCWHTAPSGPVQGRCEGLDAQECSRHDDCTATYNGFEESATFSFCSAEPGAACLGDDDCGLGSRCDTTVCNPPPGCGGPTAGVCLDVCYGVCVPSSPSCAAIDCGPNYRCEEQCYGSTGPNTMTTCSAVCVPTYGCEAALCGPNTTCVEVCATDANGVVTCSPTCVPVHDPGSCYGTVWCDLATPACPAATTPGIANGCYTGYCIPVSACGPSDPGTCDGEVACDALPPQCPANTVPGISGGCWSGYCIPVAACPAPTCETLTTEAACLANSSCTPVYDGTNCTCVPGSCSCETLAFDRCQSL